MYQEEVWVEIDGYPNYAVSNKGRIVNQETDMILRERPNENGYMRVALYQNGWRRDHYVHQLVAFAFFGDFRLGEHLEWVNGDVSDNRPENLRTKKVKRELIREAAHLRAAADEQYRPWGKRVRIVETGEVFRTVRDCANYINGDYSSIYRCLRNERASHMGFTFEYQEAS